MRSSRSPQPSSIRHRLIMCTAISCGPPLSRIRWWARAITSSASSYTPSWVSTRPMSISEVASSRSQDRRPSVRSGTSSSSSIARPWATSVSALSSLPPSSARRPRSACASACSTSNPCRRVCVRSSSSSGSEPSTRPGVASRIEAQCRRSWATMRGSPRRWASASRLSASRMVLRWPAASLCWPTALSSRARPTSHASDTSLSVVTGSSRTVVVSSRSGAHPLFNFPPGRPARRTSPRAAPGPGGPLAPPPGFEPGPSEPKSEVLPLHHGGSGVVGPRHRRVTSGTAARAYRPGMTGGGTRPTS